MLLEVEDLDFVHTFYCVVATLTGLGCCSLSLCCTPNESKDRWLNGFLKEIQRLLTWRQLILMAMDWAAECVLYKLKEMGKISQDDITPIKAI
ncbi:putative Two pore domain potassium channel, plant [Helianthus anomalus]